MKEFFKPWNPSTKSRRLLYKIDEILTLYRGKGYRLTLRQLYYQLVARDIIPNTVEEYAKIGNVVSRGRLAGYIDWHMIEDRVRTPKGRQHWDDPKDILMAAKNTYYRSRWENQNHYIEVWCEKDAISNILAPVCSKYDIIFMANRGYSSQSAMYDASKRFIEKQLDEGKNVHLIYFGDHDPSGIDMTRDIIERQSEFCGFSFHDVVIRAALNMDQIKYHNPPENPAKMTDTRYREYSRIYGTSSWELDALEPEVLDNILTSWITNYIDTYLWDEVEELEEEHKNIMQKHIDKISEDL